MNKSEIKDGMIVQLKNGVFCDVRNGCIIAKTINPDLISARLSTYTEESLIYYANHGKSISKVFDKDMNLLWENPYWLLTDKEREYLKVVCKPYKEVWVSKEADGMYEYIVIKVRGIRGYDYIELPLFEYGSKYKGLALGKEYKKVELGINYTTPHNAKGKKHT